MTKYAEILEKYTDSILIQGIRKQDSTILQYIYRKYYPSVERYILNNQGDNQDAMDIFQEAIIITYRKSLNPDFQLESSLKTYIISISKYLWLKDLRNKKTEDEALVTYAITEIPQDIDEEFIKKHQRYKIFQENYKLLSKECQKVLNLYFKEIPIAEIAKRLNYKSTNFVKKKKYECKERLIQLIKKDSRYKEDE